MTWSGYESDIFPIAAGSDNGMHPTADPTALIYFLRCGAAGDAGREAFPLINLEEDDEAKSNLFHLSAAVALAKRTKSLFHP